MARRSAGHIAVGQCPHVLQSAVCVGAGVRVMVVMVCRSIGRSVMALGAELAAATERHQRNRKRAHDATHLENGSSPACWCVPAVRAHVRLKNLK